MIKQRPAGFTLIEIVIVAAITGGLILIAFAGQRQLRDRTAFDAAINHFAAQTAAVKTESTAGVNTVGAGNGSGNCPSPNGATKYVFAGTSLVIDDQSGGPATFTVKYWRAGIDDDNKLTGSACVSDSRTFGLSYDLMVNVANASTMRGYQLLFIRSYNSSLRVCGQNDVTADVAPAFGGGACSAPSATANTLLFQETNGKQSQVIIDDSGVARRLN
jgi:prepilin-type N-terminal cleavage/methylation domain-containing protein